MQRFLFPLIGLILGAIIAFALSAIPVQAENCPNDWHEPPCGPPPKVDQRKKDVAQAAVNYHQNAALPIVIWEEVACNAAYLGYKPARLACAGAKMTRIANERAEAAQQRIVNDPYDPAFEYAYEGRWLSYEDLGLWDFIETSEHHYLAYAAAEHIQAIEMLGDFIGVSIDRANSCYGDENGVSHLCYIWQMERANVGIIWLGQRLQALATVETYIADELEPEIGNGVNGDLLYLFDEFAAWTWWAGEEHQQ
jgi:hypothetical protein